MSKLVRASLVVKKVVEDNTFEERYQLFCDASEQLGYKHGKITLKPSPNMTEFNKLADFLNSKKIAPFTNDSVQKYMERKSSSIIDRWLGPLLMLSLITSAVAVAVTAAFSLFLNVPDTLLLCPGIAAGIATVGTVACLMIESNSPNISWKDESISNYSQPIPISVLSLAMEIKKAVPNCELHVHSLIKQSKTVDPFLSVVVPGIDREIFVAVWDEPTFEG